MNSGTDLGDEAALGALAAGLDARFAGSEILLGGERATEAIRTEACGAASSRVAAVPGVRSALLERQRAFREPPGLVADGRDMGSVRSSPTRGSSVPDGERRNARRAPI